MPIVSLKDIHKSFGPDIVFDRLEQRIWANEKVALIGANGSGKTTLAKLIIGTENPDTGTIIRRNGLQIGYLPQEPVFDGNHSVLEEMESAVSGLVNMQKQMEQLAGQMESADEKQLESRFGEYDRLRAQFETAGGYGYLSRIKSVLAGLGFDESSHKLQTSQLSGGQLSRLGLAKALICGADLLILDEPTNHLDLEATRWLEQFLKSHRAAVLVISHDRFLLDSVVTKIIEIENYKTIQWKGNYSQYISDKAKHRLQLQRQYNKRIEMVEKTRDFIARNKDQEGMRKTARGRKKRLDRMLAKDTDFLERPTEQKKIRFKFATGASRSDIALRCEGLGKSFGEVVLFENLNFDVLGGQKLGITGPNGTGKSTLIKMAMKLVSPTAGQIRTGQNMSVGYLDQHGQELDPNKTVLQQGRAANGQLSEEAVRSRLGAFLFAGDDISKMTGQLSGGQQSRLMLACLMLAEPDILLLDEPTNHLDIASREALEGALSAYNGTVVAVSHDRFFLDRIVDKLLIIGANEVGIKSMGRFEFISAPAKAYSRYAEILAQRIAEATDSKTVARAGKSGKAKVARKLRKKVPKELSQFNRIEIEEIEDKIVALEEEIKHIQEGFGAEGLYQNPELLKRHQNQFDNAQAELDLLYRAYEHRLA
jgi:ATP-binding cassette, subfamily F, member 3